MNTSESIVRELRELVKAQSRIVERLRQLAPAGIYERGARKDPDASTWRHTIQRLDIAHFYLDDLADAVYYGLPGQASEGMATSASVSTAEDGSPADGSL